MFQHHAVIKNQNLTRIFFRTNQTSQPLTQFHIGFRHIIILKGILTVGFHLGRNSRNKRIHGIRERKLRNHQKFQGVSREINTFPQALTAQKASAPFLAEHGNQSIQSTVDMLARSSLPFCANSGASAAWAFIIAETLVKRTMAFSSTSGKN